MYMKYMQFALAEAKKNIFKDLKKKTQGDSWQFKVTQDRFFD